MNMDKLNHSSTSSSLSASRNNESTCADVLPRDLKSPFASGGFRWVAKGKYDAGNRKGHPCVVKWFKDKTKQNLYEDTFYSHDIQAVDKAIQIIEYWNRSEFVNKPVQMNRCEVWAWSDDNAGFHKKGTKVLVEPFIENFKKFNSNVGWTSNEVSWMKVMQALSHFSYHMTDEKYLLCDLQGGIYKDGVVLTDPVIHSTTKSYGNTDLGVNGMLTFMHRHKCNKYCKPEWKKPRRTAVYYKLKKGTTMESPCTMSVTRDRSLMENLCTICSIAKKNATFLCGHQLCYDCGTKIQNESANSVCHICRAPVKALIRLYN